MHADLLITDINELATPTGTGACRGHAMDAVDVIEDAAMAIAGDRIVWVGERDDWSGTRDEEIEADGNAVIPALVDPHTHAVWGGDRLEDFEARSRGASYEEILARGGGIRSTVAATDARRRQLARRARRRAARPADQQRRRDDRGQERLRLLARRRDQVARGDPDPRRAVAGDDHCRRC